MHTAICCLDACRLGRLKCLMTSFDAFLSSFSRSQRCSRNQSPSRLPVSLMYNFLQRVQVMSNLRDLLISSRTGSDGDLFAFLHCKDFMFH